MFGAPAAPSESDTSESEGISVNENKENHVDDVDPASSLLNEKVSYVLIMSCKLGKARQLQTYGIVNLAGACEATGFMARSNTQKCWMIAFPYRGGGLVKSYRIVDG